MLNKSDKFSVSVTKNFKDGWISKHTKKLGGVDPEILEQCVYALALLTYLAETDLDFVFKGGTCLLLKLKQINRLSIDVDITTHKSIDRLKPTLKRIANAKGFNGYKERDTRSSHELPIRYLDFSYTSTITGEEGRVSLDILREKNVFKEGTMVPVNTSFFKPSTQRLVFVPSIEELLADKLTAFAPNTVGLLYKEQQDESMPIIKQLFDVGLLFESAKKTATIRQMYRQMVNLQNKYFKTKHSVTQTAEDTIDAALDISKLDLEGVSETPEMKILRNGVKRIEGHLVKPFGIPGAKRAAARAALLAALVSKRGGKGARNIDVLRYTRSRLNQFKEIPLVGRLAVLNALANTDAEAFYYWSVFQQLEAPKRFK